MSYWKDDRDYYMSLINFIERFVLHNTFVHLYTWKRVKDDIGIYSNQYELIWKGMDWQITDVYSEPEYFRAHPEVKPCPYLKANVLGIMSLGCRSDCTDEISIVIDLGPSQEHERTMEM